MRIAGMSSCEIAWLRGHPEHRFTCELRGEFRKLRGFIDIEALDIGLIRFRHALDDWRNRRDWPG